MSTRQSYADREVQILRDLAAQTLRDPDATPTEITAAKSRLATGIVLDEAGCRRISDSLSVRERAALLATIESIFDARDKADQ